MCKLLIIPWISDDSAIQKRVKRFIAAAQPVMTATDGDGFGLMSWGERGLFAERWLDVGQALKVREEYSAADMAIERKYAGAMWTRAAYTSDGEPSDVVRSATLHARLATNLKCIENTHPFVSEDGTTGLCHNGVVSTAGLKLITSTCDSEGILNAYTSLGVANDVSNFDLVAKKLKGYYALSIISQLPDGTPILDVVKDDRAQLTCAFVPKLDALVFATNMRIIEGACAKLKWAVGSEFTLEDNIIMRHSLTTGEVLNVYPFVPSKSQWTSTYNKDEDEYDYKWARGV